MQFIKTGTIIAVAMSFCFLTACATTPADDHCSVSLKPGLASAMRIAEDKLSEGCEYSFDNYFSQLLDVASDNPDPDNKRLFSEFLVNISDRGIISKRQARAKYNRYFNVKFVSLTGDYNTCSQTCPIRDKVLADMHGELLDKELGLVKATENSAAYYRSDLLLKEVELVLEATCRACEAGGSDVGR